MKATRRICLSGILFLLLLLIESCGNPTWNADVEDFVENGLSNMGLAGTVHDSDGSAIDYLTSNQETIVRVNLFNPKQLAADYTLTIGDPTLYDSTPVLSETDYRTLTLPIDPTLAAEHHTLEFTLGIYVPSLNRTYPDQTLTFQCETAPNPPQALMGGTTDNDKAMIAFQVPQDATDADIETIEIRWGPSGSGNTNTFTVDDASLLSPPPDGENLLGSLDSQNRYFYPAAAAIGSVYAFNVTLIDAYGRRSETRSTASDLVEYSLAYNANDADSGTAPATAVYEFGTEAAIASNSGNLVRAGYVFEGWNTEADGTGTDYAPGQSVTMDSGNLVLYAKWLQYIVHFQNGNGNVTTDPPASVGYGPGQTVTAPGYDPDNLVDGYYFLGWDTNNAASTAVYEPGDTFTMGSADLYLYAVWARCMGSQTDLEGITDFDGDYYLLNDIVLTSQWTDFIGVTGNPFTGRFFGNGHTISALHIVESTEPNVGLFGYLGSGGEIHDLNVSGGLEIEGCNSAGLLAGYSMGLISNCSATGTITDMGSGGNTDVGGLVGYGEDAVFEDCETTVDITVYANDVGGIAGHAIPQCSFTNCTANGSTTGAQYVGGIIGYSYSADIDQCIVNGSVEGTTEVGGIAGVCYAGDNITNCTVNGAVTGTSGMIGGLVGTFWQYSGSIIGNTVYGPVSGDGDSIGGLIGYSCGVSVDGCIAASTVTCEDSNEVGGLIGTNVLTTSGTTAISDSSATGSVTVNGFSGSQSVGGLIGCNDNSLGGTLEITDCNATGDITAQNDTQYVGGLIGRNTLANAGSTSIADCYATGMVRGWNWVGGLIGINDGPSGSATASMAHCFASGDVQGNTLVGGLVGENIGFSITECYASGGVSADSMAAGLVCRNTEGEIGLCYAIGDVYGTMLDGAGLIYDNQDTGPVSNCYYGGTVSGNINSYNCLFSSANAGTAPTSYYLSGSSTGGSTVMGYPRTANDLRDTSTYDPSWDFAAAWGIGDMGINNGFPYIQYFLDRFGYIDD